MLSPAHPVRGLDFYPRSPCGERHIVAVADCFRLCISIHALLAESDTLMLNICAVRLLFLSTLSLRRATVPFRPASHLSMYFYPRSPCGERRKARPKLPKQIRISIHALLAESDMRQRRIELGKFRFLSTLSLRRATPHFKSSWQRCCNFYPRSPCGERQVSANATHVSSFISIHALLAESDK